jgi:hypothetical protein
MEAQRDLLGPRRVNIDVEIFKLLCELLNAVTRPEVAFFSIASKLWNLVLPYGCCTH